MGLLGGRLDQHEDEIGALIDGNEDVTAELAHFLCVPPGAMIDLLKGDSKRLISAATRIIAESYFLGQRAALEGLRGPVDGDDAP